MIESPVPLLSTHNGPSYLLHAVQTLYTLGVPEPNVRLTPVIGWCLGPEVEPYYRQSNLAQLEHIDSAKLFVRLNINIRGDRRLRRFLPLTAVGIAPLREVVAWRERGDTAGDGYRHLYDRLGKIDPDWTNNEAPAERLTRQLCALFPDLRDPGMLLVRPSDRMLLVRPDRWEERPNPYVNVGSRREIESDAPHESARALVELFLTRALILVATADMLGGFEYQMHIEPEGRAIDVVIAQDSDLHQVVRWLHAYPHRPLPEVRYPERDADERAQWDSYFAGHPDHDNIFETAAKHWTEEDPAIVALYGDIRREYDEKKRYEAITSDEMLAFARKHLPDYVPCYPHQFAVTGGMNLEGILIGLMDTWLGQGPFLGVTGEDWDLFPLEDRVVLCGLLMQRRQILDQSALFQAAVRLLVDPAVGTAVEAYRLEAVRLGKPLAQPNRTLSLDGVAALHAPEMVVNIPFDRDQDERSPTIERKLSVIARLFLPVHITMKTIWKIDRPYLGRATYLRRKRDAESPTGPACRLS